MSASLIRDVTEETGKKVEQEQRTEALIAYTHPEEAAPQFLPAERKRGTLYVLTDGSQVNTRQQGKDGSTWKEMKLGEVYSDDHVIRSQGGRALLTQKEYVAYFGSVEGLKPLLFDAAARAGYGQYERTVMIGDGAHWICNLCDELFPDAIQVLDYYHMSEHVYAYARYLYPENEGAMKGWAKATIKDIECGNVEGVIASLDGANVPPGVANLRQYLGHNRHRVNYQELKDQGLHVGSGAIESGNKKVIQQRMKQSGMRWGEVTGQYVAILRAKSASMMWAYMERMLCISWSLGFIGT